MFTNLPPLVKNSALAFAAAFLTSFAGFLAFTDTTDLPGLKAAGLAAVYAGGRALVGYLKEQTTGVPFAVDTEAPVE